MSFSAQAQTCPRTFDVESETQTQLVCLFQAELTMPVSSGTPPHQTPEGIELAAPARNLCAAANGQAFSFSQGTSGVRVRCTLIRTTPPPTTPPPTTPPPTTPPPTTPPPTTPPPPTPPPPTPPMPDVPEPIDFDDAPGFEVEGTDDVATSLSTLCRQFRGGQQLTAAQTDLLGICERINSGGDVGAQLNAIQQVAARQYSEVADLIGFQNSVQVGDIGSRLASVRPAMEQNARDVANGGILRHPDQGLLAKRPNSANLHGGAAGDDEISNDSNRFGLFVAFSGGSGDKETNAVSRGFDYKSRNATIGLDYAVNSSVIVGLALGYGETESALFQNSGQLDIESNTISLYASKFFASGWFLDGVIGQGRVTTESRRNIDFSVGQDTISQIALAEFESDQNLVSVGIGKRFEAYLNVDLSARVNYIDTDVERFAEATNPDQLGFGLAIEIDDQDITSLTSDISIRVSRPYSYNWGVLIPEASLRWQHEFDRGEGFLLGRFLSDPNGFDFQRANINEDEFDPTIFNVPLELIDTNYGAAKLGINALLPRNFSLSANISQTIGLSGFDHTYLSFLIRKDF